mgnify:CR=1 FL=1
MERYWEGGRLYLLYAVAGGGAYLAMAAMGLAGLGCALGPDTPEINLRHEPYSVARTYWARRGGQVILAALERRIGGKGSKLARMQRLGCEVPAWFGIEAEVTGGFLRRGERIYEVPISYKARSREEGKKITWKDGIKAILTIIRFRFTD